MKQKDKDIYISVILSTYNQPEWLKMVLYGYNQQNISNFEVVIADDGSRETTKLMINKLKEELKFPIQHIWHEDNGFQKCVILNKAIAASKGNYLVFSDGDCIPRKDFLEVHQSTLRKGYFLSGGMFRTTKEVAHKISIPEIEDQSCFNIKKLRELGQPKKIFKDLKCSLQSKRVINIANNITPTNASWNGHNSSGWKNDIIKVNGFDERMKYGGEDRELGERLFNLGIKSKQIRYSAICIHLEHDRGYVTEEDWANNNKIRKDTNTNKRIWTDYGVDKYLPI